MRNNTNVPCKDCQRRQVGCHSNCDEYKAFKADKALETGMINAERNRYREIDNARKYMLSVRRKQRGTKNI